MDFCIVGGIYVLLSDEDDEVALRVERVERAGDVPVPLRGLDEVGRVVARPLAAGTAAQIVRVRDRVRVQVAESIPPELRWAVAEHAYRVHRRACLSATCAVATMMLGRGEPEAVIA